MGRKNFGGGTKREVWKSRRMIVLNWDTVREHTHRLVYS
jgi:hypothetical protein